MSIPPALYAASLRYSHIKSDRELTTGFVDVRLTPWRAADLALAADLTLEDGTRSTHYTDKTTPTSYQYTGQRKKAGMGSRPYKAKYYGRRTRK